MNIGIWGTKSEALYLAEEIEKNSREIHVSYYIDNNANSKCTNRIDIPRRGVIRPSQLIKLYKKEIDAVIVAVRGTYSRMAIIQQLKNMGIDKVGIFKFSACDFGKKVNMAGDGSSDYVVWINEIKKPIIPYLETHVNDSCNLNCKGCTHFSNLYANDERVTFESFVEDIDMVSKKSYVIQLRLMGGEPLLNPECHKYISCAREKFPKADIELVTNGLLIFKQHSELFQTMRDNQVGFHISQYEPTMKIRDLIEEKCKEEKVDYFFERSLITDFAKHLSMMGNSDVEAAQLACISRGCRFLRKGRLYKCPTEGLIDKFAEKYEYDDVLKELRGFDIYDNAIDWEQQLNNYLNLPVPVCKYCSESRDVFRWEIQNNPDAKDWLNN